MPRRLLVAFVLPLAACGHGCPSIRAELEVAGPTLESDALEPARRRLQPVRAGAPAWHDVQAQRAAVLEDVARAYRDAGYPEARAGGFVAQLAADRERIRVGVRVVAGPRRRLGGVRVVTVGRATPASLADADDEALARLRDGGWYREDAVDAAVTALQRAYQERGYARAVVAPRRRVVGDAVQLELQVEPGPVYRIEAVALSRDAGRRARALDPEALGLRRGAAFRLSAVEAAAAQLEARYGATVRWRLVPRGAAEGPRRGADATLRFILP